MIEASAFERVVHLTGPVGGQDRQWRRCGPDVSEFGDRHRVLVQQLEQERLELVVGAVDLVDEEYTGRVGKCLKERPGEQETFGVERGFGCVGVQSAAAGRFECAQVQQLAREIPVVESLRGIDALVTLQPDQWQLRYGMVKLAEKRRAALRVGL